MYGVKQTAIVIPIYKEELSVSEEISLSQVQKVLGNFDTYFLCPESLRYKYRNKNIKEIRFDDKYFLSLRNYSEFMLQKELYQTFSLYEYILVYQLDSFVFSNHLQYFINLGYDYIGAPWIHGIALYKDVKHIVHYIGNGGFSLRKVSAFLKWLNHVDLSDYIKEINEDVLIAAFGAPALKMPSIDVSLEFSFDMDPRSCYKQNKKRLPFGCHAWQKIDMEFWRPYIKQYGYQLDNIPDSGLYRKYEQRYKRDEVQKERLSRLSCEKIIKPLMCKLTENGKKYLYIWGTGVWGSYTGNIFYELGIRVEGFVDNKDDFAQTFLGHQVLNGKKFLAKKRKDIAVFVAIQNSEEIEKQMGNAGYSHMQDYMTLKDLG